MERGAFLQVSSVVITIEREKRVLWIAISVSPVLLILPVPIEYPYRKQ